MHHALYRATPPASVYSFPLQSPMPIVQASEYPSRLSLVVPLYTSYSVALMQDYCLHIGLGSNQFCSNLYCISQFTEFTFYSKLLISLVQFDSCDNLTLFF